MTSNANTKSSGTRLRRDAQLRWVPIPDMDVSELAQRKLNIRHVAELAQDLNTELLGHPVVSERDGKFWIVDGQHRIAALKAAGREDQLVQCEVYTGLDEQAEADLFLRLNTVKQVGAFDKFMIGVQAGWPVESDIDRIVRSAGLTVARGTTASGSIGAVAVLRRNYERGPSVLLRSLIVARDAFGDAGLEGPVLDGLGLVCHRYNGEVNDAMLTTRLAKTRGGVGALLGRAEVTRRQTGQYKSHCVAAVIVDQYNAGRGGNKLPSWWKATSAEALVG